MGGFAGSAAVAKQAYTFMLLGAPLLPYRPKFAAAGGATVGMGAPGSQEVGIHDAAYDPLENSPTDSTVDGGTGYAGGWGPAIQVHVMMLTGEQAKYRRGKYGLEFEETGIAAFLLASEVSPTYQDMIVDADGTHYCVGQDVAAFAVMDTVYGYRVTLERRDANDVVMAL